MLPVLLAASFLASTLTVTTEAQLISSSKTVGLWHMNEIVAAGHLEITPDATGDNPGTLIRAPLSPRLVEGRFEKALKFDGNNGVYVPIRFIVGFPPSPEPIYIPVSTSLDIQKELRIEAWISAQGFKDAPYNNIVVKCSRRDASSENTTRVYGIAIKPDGIENGHSVPRGALSGYVFTDTGGFNEIITTDSVVPLNEWVHVAFTRSLTTGMHLYINGKEKAIKPLYGTQNPSGTIIDGTEVYFGHDAITAIDEIVISDLSPESGTLKAEFDIGPNLLVAVITVTSILSVALILRRLIQMWTIRSKP